MNLPRLKSRVLARIFIKEVIKIKATNIIWDVDYEEDREYLPTEIEIPKDITDIDDISDYISDITGYCHKGFCLE